MRGTSALARAARDGSRPVTDPMVETGRAPPVTLEAKIGASSSADTWRPGTLRKMSTREPAHAKEETAIFDAFLVAYPSFAGQVKKVDQPDAPFPDVVVELLDGGLVDFELGGSAQTVPRRERPSGQTPSPRR